MSKSVTVTLDNAVSDTLDRHMATMNAALPAGARVSKSNYVSESVRERLTRDGVPIKAEEDRLPPAPIQKRSGLDPL